MAFSDTRKGGKITSRSGEPAPDQGLLGETVVEGDALSWDNGNNHWDKAFGDTAALKPVHAIAGRSGVAGERIPLLTGCTMEGRITGATTGAPIYLDNAAGKEGYWTGTAPGGGSGDDNTVYGFSQTPTRAVFQLPNVRTVA